VRTWYKKQNPWCSSTVHMIHHRDLVKRTYKAAVKPLKKEPKGFEAWIKHGTYNDQWIKQKKKGY
jgi:hypothetical protein